MTVDANGINVSTFTAPTAGAPGKSGLVPQPQATDPAAQLANILTMQGWGSLSSAFVAKDPTSADSKKLCPALTFGEELNANALASGFFHSAKWTNAPAATSGTLLSIQMPLPQGYSVIQIFFSYTGHSSYRTTIGTVAYGQTPENATWEDWVTPDFEAPLAFDAAEGKVKLSVGNTTTVTADKLEVKVAPNGGLQGTTNGIVIKPVASGPVTVDANGINVRTFTAPTAGAPGKSGLVPQPQATPDGTLTILTNRATWKAFAEQFAALGTGGTISETVKGISSGSINTVTEPGTYNVSVSGVTDLPIALSGGSIMKVYGPATNRGAAFRADTLQILYAETSSGIQIWAHFALSPNIWNNWIRIDGLGNAPRPQAAAGVGQWRMLWNGTNGGNTIKLPNGGVWAYWLRGIGYANNYQVITALHVSVKAGGSTITEFTTSATPTTEIVGMCWRIA